MIVRLTGGLGNQLFQFAAAKVLEKKYGDSIIIDDSYYAHQPKKDTQRDLEIFQFDVGYSRKSNRAEQNRIRTKVVIQKIFTRLPLLNQPTLLRPALRGMSIYNEDSFINQDVLKKNICVIGHFQNYSFLKDYIDVIREEFTLASEVKEQMLGLNAYRYISEHDNTVAVHIRRGDYVSNSNASSFHGLCGVDYYKKTIDLLSTKIAVPNFVFFSDDIEWVKKTFSWVPGAYYVDHGIATYSAVDMFLMSLCKHNIIANSTYSWWGAVLNTNPDKIVVCPEKWTLGNSIDQLYVDGWIKM